jgi:Flp pilus assembly protein TadD
MNRHPFLSLITCITAAVLFGCQTTPQIFSNDKPEALLVNKHFAGETHEPESITEIFALPDNIKQQLRKVSNAHKDTSRKAKAIVSFILSYADDGLLYDSVSTRTAAQTLANGRANCLSLSILAYSLASELGLDAVFQDVQIPEYWTSDLNRSWLNGHVNVRLRQKDIADSGFGLTILGTDVVVDFDPYSSKTNFPAKLINRQRVVAMFYNNKAAHAFASDDYAQAYRYYRAAAQLDPKFAVTWSNLAILYRVHGFYDLAERSYNFSLSLDPTSTNTLSNLALLYRHIGEIDKARALEERVLAKRNSNPYYYLMLGNEAYRSDDLKQALSHFSRALRLDRQNHEAFFGLAKTYYMLENTERASHFLGKALRSATSIQDQRRYEYKLAMLNQLAAAH